MRASHVTATDACAHLNPAAMKKGRLPPDDLDTLTAAVKRSMAVLAIFVSAKVGSEILLLG